MGSGVSNANVELRLDREVGERDSARDAPTVSKSGQDERPVPPFRIRARALRSRTLIVRSPGDRRTVKRVRQLRRYRGYMLLEMSVASIPSSASPPIPLRSNAPAAKKHK